MSNDLAHVSDHALIRYMERVLGMDIEQLRAHIAEGTRRHQRAPCVRTLGARFLLVNGRIVTVIEGRSVPSYDALVRLIRDSQAEAV
ncbi:MULTISPECIES: hypothetical protein [unclassified Mesorhizobium]|uniref:hypothetical protein n=1 Tax=unclassified Mesorhizobium TaxID=325217 RepID=UPI00067F20B7|nr:MULTISPECIES: hypothetical protein [unclassified Mesorhizobium]WJI81491.1 hypothetical protein NLY34_01640 [Mesorhizobium sp. C374B]WJI88010.1 hypothetical protein NLY42_04055 [Mesorhizobium sp. C372A]